VDGTWNVPTTLTLVGCVESLFPWHGSKVAINAMDILAESQTKVRRIAHFLPTEATSLTWHYGIDA
jgi:hypothetical protein